MNHYPRHVGDITRDTFGLSLTEFGAYDRLIDAYYASEYPLPLDRSERYRMAGALGKADKAAVDYVVSKFFVEQSDGWHQKRCDAEIVEYHLGDEERELREANERERVRRHREERSALFAKLREAGIVPKWDTAISTLRAMACNGPVTRTDTASNGLDTANQNQNQNQNQILKTSTKTKAAASPPWLDAELWQHWREARRKAGAAMSPHAETLLTAKLFALKAQGHDPKAVIEQSIERGWKGFFPIGDQPRHSNAKDAARSATLQAIMGPFQNQPKAEHDERDITGESQRLTDLD